MNELELRKPEPTYSKLRSVGTDSVMDGVSNQFGIYQDPADYGTINISSPTYLGNQPPPPPPPNEIHRRKQIDRQTDSPDSRVESLTEGQKDLVLVT